MPLAGVIATQLTDHGPRPHTLVVGAVDVTLMVDVTTIDVTEMGPGGVSSMSFDIKDETLAVNVVEGSIVRHHDNTADLPVFLGHVQTFSVNPTAIGRVVRVTAVGIEAVLDWALVPTHTTRDITTDIGAVVQSLFSAAIPTGFSLRVVAPTDHTTPDPDGSFEVPIGGLTDANELRLQLNDFGAVTITGQSLRAAIHTVLVYPSQNPEAYTDGSTPTKMLTIDFWGNLRLWRDDVVPHAPADYATLTISDTVGGAVAAASLEHETDVLTPHSVYVLGSNAAGTGLVSDGTGLPGPVDYIDNPDSDSAAILAQTAAEHFASTRTMASGRLTIESWKPTTNIRAGSPVVITDAQAGLSAASFRISSIHKTFHGDRQRWDVTYGGLPPSLARAIPRVA